MKIQLTVPAQVVEEAIKEHIGSVIVLQEDAVLDFDYSGKDVVVSISKNTLKTEKPSKTSKPVQEKVVKEDKHVEEVEKKEEKDSLGSNPLFKENTTTEEEPKENKGLGFFEKLQQANNK